MAGRLGLAVGGVTLLGFAVWLAFAPPDLPRASHPLAGTVAGRSIPEVLLEDYEATRVAEKRRGVDQAIRSHIQPAEF